MDLGVAVLGFGWLFSDGNRVYRIWVWMLEMELRCIYFGVYRYQLTLNIFTFTSTNQYEKNLKLLKEVRASTLLNKSELKSHIQVINSVKDQLDKARRNLVGPLIKRAQSNSFGLEGQLEEVEKTYGFLKGVRDTQKHRVLRELWGNEPKRRVQITSGHDDDVDEMESM